MRAPGDGPDLPPRSVRLAAAAYPIEALSGWDALAAKLDAWVADAAGEGAEIAVLPEYGGMEAALADAPGTRGIADWCAASAAASGRYAALCSTLAQRHRLMLLAGGLPSDAVFPGGERRLVNRSWLCLPDGQVIAQDKQVLTPWERSETPMAPGQPLAALEAGVGRLATLVCYDAEFPPLARALAPDILLIPSSTEAPAGNARVAAAARARALEAQCVTVHAPLIGGVATCEIVDANTGAAGIYAPPDRPFPDDGVLARGVPDTPGWIFATVERGALGATRSAGAVSTRADMEAADRAARGATTRRLRELGP